MSAQHPMTIGVIGAGNWAHHFWAKAQRAPGLELTACWDPKPEAAHKFATTYRCEAAPTLEELLANPDLEAVANFAPNNCHREPTEKAAAAGKHVFTEKPIANTIEDALAMIRACEKAGVTLMVGHSSRYFGSPRALKQLLDSGRLGTLVMAEGNSSHSGGARLSENEWRWHREEAPGGPLMQLAVHTFDTMHYLFGPTRRVTALSSSSLLPSEIEDVFLTLLEFESGLLAYVGTNYVSPSVGYLRVYGMSGNVICADEDYTGGRQLTLIAPDPNDPWDLRTEEVPVPEINAPAAEMAEFARAVRTGAQPETGGKEGILALAVVWAAIMSAEQNRSVEIKEALGPAASLFD